MTGECFCGLMILITPGCCIIQIKLRTGRKRIDIIHRKPSILDNFMIPMMICHPEPDIHSESNIEGQFFLPSPEKAN